MSPSRLLVTCGLLASAYAFIPLPSIPGQCVRERTVVEASRGQQEPSRGDHLRNIATGLLASATVLGTASPAKADVGKANRILADYGLPPILGVPGGFSALAEIYGRAQGISNTRDPLLVAFVYPFTWVVQRPSVNNNGEDGTIAVGNYQRGDTAALYVGDAPSGKLDDQSQAFFGDVIVKALTQKGDNMYQGYKTLGVRKGAVGTNGSQYYIVDFRYELLTGAGFTIDRRGIASVTNVGPHVEAMVAAATTQRWKSLKDDLTTIVESFRCYDGIAV